MAVRRLHDEQPKDFTFTPENLSWVKAKIADYPEGRQVSAVIPLLWRAQEQYGGWLPEPAIRLVADMLDMPYIRALEIATFYTMFQLAPVGTTAHIGVCGTTPCMLRGSEALVALCKSRIAERPFTVSEDGRFSWEEVECAGACVNGPMVQIGADTYEDLTEETFGALLDKLAAGEAVTPGPQSGRRRSEPHSGLTSLKAVPSREPLAAVPEDPPEDGLPDEGLSPAHSAAAGEAIGHPGPGERAEVEVARRVGSNGEDEDGASHPQARFAALGAEAPKSPISAQDAARVSGPPTATSSGPPETPAAQDAAFARADAAGERPPEAPADAPRDNLQRISGIGPKIERTLNELGITTFAQIAAWTPQQTEWVNTYLKFSGRIGRERWIEQARELEGSDGG